MLVTILVAIFTLIVLLSSYPFLTDKLRRYRLPPGPFSWPWIGSLHVLLDVKSKPWNIFREKLLKKHGKIVTFYFGQYRSVVLFGPTVIRKALIAHGKDFNNRPFGRLPITENVYTAAVLDSDGPLWVKLRRFSVKGLRDFGLGQEAMEVRIQNEALILAQEINGQAGQENEQFNDLVTRGVSNIVCCLIFGQRFDFDDNRFVELLKTAQILFERPFTEGILHFAFPFLRFFGKKPIFAKDISNVEKAAEKLLITAIEEHRQNFSPDDIQDFIDVYLQETMVRKESFPFRNFVATMRDMILAGTETTASALNWTVLYLCRWPEIQKKCQREIDHVLGDSNRPPGITDRPHLVYIDAVMCEILRHATIVPSALFHYTTDKFVEFEGYEIPPRTIIHYQVWDVHHDKEYWGDPEVFRPERWIDVDGSLLTHNNYFMPFGTGPRICLGEQLARLEYFIFLVTILQRFSFTSPTLENYSGDVDFFKTSWDNITHAPPKFTVIATSRVQ